MPPKSQPYWQMPAFLDDTTAEASYDEMPHEDYLTYRIGMLSGEFNRNISKYFSRHFGLTLAEGRVLARLVNSGPQSYGEICETLLLDGAQISRAAAALADRGYICKGDDPKDARRAIFELTEEGQEVGREVIRVGRARQKFLLQKLSATERRTLYRTLSKLMGVMADLNAEGILLGEAATQESV
ncbi:MarR family transcriptional regulator [Pseudooceanicola sediminis]|uniref:MarR family transcriptional regulator n=1 Tax=Pseudooceanicola sediminis TaxID=2211117 RepID=A0A399J417_9RHOB|nr:MarR family winged helix-turn-helix transcriptional regulator [Pseudooceanicola sediminis]KAA2313885.1 winged helix-turn-helix transcriptional regulator [Puniceibacterium sp. HSS470]RII38702.1 MarR family transcriptional regulator [Pseudooceanicola sediminis]|tara:strand:- start:2677 stop:3231 length:555 start_codon:yes stop_codon:yes gene_type:complete